MPNLMNMYCLNEVGRLMIPHQNDTQSVIPKTPEIINTLIALENPLDAYMKNARTGTVACPTNDQILPSDPRCMSPGHSQISSNTSQVDSVPTSRTSDMPDMRLELIKETLKVTLQKKLRSSLSSSEYDSSSPTNNGYCSSKHDESSMDTEEDDTSSSNGDTGQSTSKGLTREDEERRNRRRERNKIAATKCRLKKRERTVNLAQEADALTEQHEQLKSKILELMKERDKLKSILTMHELTCVHLPPSLSPPSSTSQNYLHQIQPSSFVEQLDSIRSYNDSSFIDSVRSGYESVGSAGPRIMSNNYLDWDDPSTLLSEKQSVADFVVPTYVKF